MKDGSYFFLTRLLNLFLWRGKLIGRENIPANGPAVIIANHLDAFGPIGTMASLPIRVHPWSVANMMDKDLAPAWLQWDFVERQLHLKPPFSAWFSKTLCRITVPLFYSLGCIPVYRNDYRKMQQTLQMSVQVLGMDKYLLIFPEDPNLGTDPSTNMAPYQHTFTRLGELLFAESGKQLAF
jgi:1-acyl-sn-glycerol-3-phosphate acyltransferase